MSNHFFAAVESRATAPGSIFLQARPGSPHTAWTYADMLAKSAAMARALTAHGVAPGDRVAAQIEKSPEGLMLYLGTIRAGAIFLPLNTAYTDAELDYFLRDAAPALLVCDPARHAGIADLAEAYGVGTVLTLGADGRGSLSAAAARHPPAFSDISRAHNELAAILYTSGTTGRSKGAMLTHGNLVSNAATLVDLWRFTATDRLLHALPTYHTHGLFVATNVVLFAGASMDLLAKFDAGAVCAAMAGATAMMGVPTFYTRLLERADFTAATAASVRLFISGSAPLLAETHRAWEARTGQAILERYGMTETNMTTSNPYDGERRAGTVGFPLPGVSLRVVDPDTGAALDRGTIGMIEVKGPNVFAGYWRNRDKTAESFRPDGFFITGDLGRIDADGYVHIVGRGKDLIISGGFNVYPKEVEREIDALPGVLESAVIGLPHTDLGEAVLAVVVRQTTGAAIGEDAIRRALESRLARFKQPKRVVFARELPRNAMGKVQKAALRADHARAFVDP